MCVAALNFFHLWLPLQRPILTRAPCAVRQTPQAHFRNCHPLPQQSRKPASPALLHIKWGLFHSPHSIKPNMHQSQLTSSSNTFHSSPLRAHADDGLWTPFTHPVTLLSVKRFQWAGVATHTGLASIFYQKDQHRPCLNPTAMSQQPAPVAQRTASNTKQGELPDEVTQILVKSLQLGAGAGKFPMTMQAIDVYLPS